MSPAQIFRRILSAIPAMFGVLIVSFILTRLSGDPTNLMLPPDATNEARAAFRAMHHLDGPLIEQFFRFMRNAVMGDFGTSLRFGEPAGKLVLERLGATLQLALVTIAIAVCIGIPSGIAAAVWRGGSSDVTIRGIAVLGQAVPTFYVGVVSIIIFAVGLRWLPTGGRGDILSIILPAVTLSLNFIAIIIRMVRSSMLDVLGQDFVRTARAKGLSAWSVVWRHSFPNALIPVTVLIALQIGTLMGGVVVTETVFSWPGIGQLAIQAIYARDFPVVQAVVFFFATTFVIVNLLADIAVTFIDPRVRV